MQDDSTAPVWLQVAAMIGLLATAALAVGLMVGAAPAAGQPTPTPEGNISDTAPYYADDNASVANESWLGNRTDPTLQNVTYWTVRIGPWLIGDGSQAPGGVGLAGSLILGLAVGGALLGPVSRANVGPVAGGVLAVTLVFGLTAAALAPAWLLPVGLFVVGLVLTVVIVRAIS
jgi:hypothetical protein